MTEQEKDEYILKINEVVDTGREVLCIDNYQVEKYLTKGKRYKVYSHVDNTSIRIITKNTLGNDVFSSFSRSRFQSIEDIREEKLKQLGIV
jgi:hypothetical protein